MNIIEKDDEELEKYIKNINRTSNLIGLGSTKWCNKVYDKQTIIRWLKELQYYRKIHKNSSCDVINSMENTVSQCREDFSQIAKQE